MGGVASFPEIVPNHLSWTVLMCISAAAFLAARHLKRLEELGTVPGYRPLISPLSIPGALLPPSWWNLGMIWYWRLRETSYFNKTHDVISIIPILYGHPVLYVGELHVAQQLLAREAQRLFIKPEEFADAFEMWGTNVLTANGETWKRHRRVMTPAFNAKTFSLVAQETSSIYKETVESEGWNGCATVSVSDVKRLTLHTAFLTIVRCGFSFPLKWVPSKNEPRGALGNSDLHSIFDTILKSHMPCLLIPGWMFSLPIPYLKQVAEAKSTLMSFMHTSIESRLKDIEDDTQTLQSRHDVFTKLVASSMGLHKLSLEEEEVIGNLFVLLFAGHETTGLVLAETLAYLALYQEEQDKAVNEIIEAIGDLDPTYESVQRMQHTLACFIEAARLYPPATALIRVLPEDTVISVQRPAPRDILIKKGTLVSIDMISIHHNPNTFSKPKAYMPSRWYGTPESQLSPFGFGPRACIGRKFSLIEALTFLALLLRDWRVEVDLMEGETLKQYEERVMHKAGHLGLTFGVTADIPLKFSKRT